MNRRICVVTGSRAEYGLLRWVMEGVRSAPGLDLQIIATGAHVSPQFGNTYREIESDGFQIAQKVEMLLSADTPTGVATSMGIGLIGIGAALNQLRPHILLVLGDRFETFSAVAAALVAGIPVAHLHGGESTEGAFDESIRHAVTKMSHWHFVAAEPYRRRVVQMGEHPDRVFLVGGLGVDGIKKLPLLDRAALEQSLAFSLGSKSLLVTYHPVTLERSSTTSGMVELLAALDRLSDTRLILTMPNADTDHVGLFEMIEQFVSSHENAIACTSLGHQRYLSCVAQVDGVVGNSSSGLTEVPTFHKGTVNIGDRQRGRLKAASVIDCPPERDGIAAAIDRLYSPEFQAMLPSVRNPYGDGGASDKIVSILSGVPLDGATRKSFYDIGLDESHQ